LGRRARQAFLSTPVILASSRSHSSSSAMFLHEPAQRQPKPHHYQHKAQHANGKGKEQRSQERVVEAKDPIFQIVDDRCRLLEWDGSRRIVDHQHIAIAFIIISSPVARIHYGRGKCCVLFLFDQTCFSQVSAYCISFQINGRSNMMGGKMVGPAELNPLVIGGLSHPDELSPDERSCLPESNMPADSDIGGGLFKRQILDSPKDVEITDWGRWVTSVSKTISSNFS